MTSSRPISDYISEIFKGLLFSFMFFMFTVANYYGITPVVLLSLLFTLIYMTAINSSWNKYDYWGFNGQTLIRGKKTNLTISITDVRSIRIGLPEFSGWVERLRKYNSPSNYNRRQQRAQETILLYLDNNSVVPVGLKFFKNGEVLTIFLLLSFLNKVKPGNTTIEALIRIVKTAKNISDYEKQAEKESLPLDGIGLLMGELIRKYNIKNVTDAYSSSELEKLSFSSINRVIQL